MTEQRFAFHWRWPVVDFTRPAIRRRFDLRFNRYPGVIIDIHLQIGRRGVGLRWGRPGRLLA